MPANNAENNTDGAEKIVSEEKTTVENPENTANDSSVDNASNDSGSEKTVKDLVEKTEETIETIQESVSETAEEITTVVEEVTTKVEEKVDGFQEAVEQSLEESKPEETLATENEVEKTPDLPEQVTKTEEPVAQEQSKAHQDIAGIEDDEDDDSEVHYTDDDIDFTSFDKKEYLSLAEKMLVAIKKSDIKNADVKNIDSVSKELKSSFDELVQAEKSEALKAYKSETGSADGFDFKNDNINLRFESIIIQIRDERHQFYKKLEVRREDYFETKTNLLQKLREVVEEEEKGGSKENWEAFKKIQNDWKEAGNVPSPHNGSFWSAYNALLDRYFDIRSIQNELKELDRKKNLETRTALVEKIEEIAATLENEELSNTKLSKANDLLNEYKHTGPGPRAEQEVLWERLKAAFDIIYDKKRAQGEEMEGIMTEIFDAKSTLVEKLKPYLEFNSNSINEWNAKTKEVQAIQEQWNALKGPMPREKAKTTSKEFWGSLKTFFKNKSNFFAELEKEREVNLKAKQELCDQVEAFVKEEDTSADNTNKVIELQKTWRTIGHVPKKYKDSIYKRFKKSCDAFFNLKRDANKEQIEEYKNNLTAKEALCETIETEVKDKKVDLTKLADYKKQYNEIGFVPRGDMDKIQNRFIKAINGYVKASSKIEGDEQEKLLLKNEVEVSLNTGGNPRALLRQESDLRRKLKSLEDDINQLRTNIEFFGRSKNADKLKAEYEQKIEKSENEANKIKEKIKLIASAS